MAILSYFEKYFTYLIPELKSYRIESTYANGNLLYSKGNFVGEIYTGSGDKIYSDGDYYGDHYVSCIALDDHGLTILNSGGIRIYKEAGDDGASIQYDENGDVWVGKEKADPVFYADEKGNLVLKGIVYADGGEFNGTIYATGGVFSGKIEANEGVIAGFTIGQKNYNGILGTDDFSVEVTEVYVYPSLTQSIYTGFDVTVTAESWVTILCDTTVTVYVPLTVTSMPDLYINVKVTFEPGETQKTTNFDYSTASADARPHPNLASVEITGVEEDLSDNPATERNIHYGKAAYDSDEPGVYIGTDGIGLGVALDLEKDGSSEDAAAFYVSREGYLSTRNANVAGVGSFDTCNANSVSCSQIECTGTGEKASNFAEISAGTVTAESMTISNGGSCNISITPYVGNGNEETYIMTVDSANRDGDSIKVTLKEKNSKKLLYTQNFSIVIRKGSNENKVIYETFTFPAGASEHTQKFFWSSSATGKTRVVTFLNSNGAEVEEYSFSQYSSTVGDTIMISGSIVPSQNIGEKYSQYSLGDSSHIWAAAYMGSAYYDGNGEATASDLKLKQDIATLSEQYIGLFNNLKPVQFRYIKNPTETHLGLIAQDVEQAIADSGLTDQNLDIVKINNETYYLVYDEFIPLCIEKIKELEKRILRLENVKANE